MRLLETTYIGFNQFLWVRNPGVASLRVLAQLLSWGFRQDIRWLQPSEHLAALSGLLILVCIGESSPSSLVLRVFHGASGVSYNMAAAFPRASNIRKQKEAPQLLSPSCRSHISSFHSILWLHKLYLFRVGCCGYSKQRLFRGTATIQSSREEKNPMAERIPVHTKDGLQGHRQ